MNLTTFSRNSLTRLALAGVCFALAACSGPSRPKPTEIQGVTVLQDMRTSWTANLGPVDFPLVVSASDDRIALANSQGVVAVLDASTGKDIWRLRLDQAISAGVGSDGQQVAVVTRNNELVALRDGKVMWRKGMPAQSFTAPLVAGGRVFLFLETDDFARDHARMTAAGIAFEEEPRHESYGTVAVWRDPFGNRWDLIGRH